MYKRQPVSRLGAGASRSTPGRLRKHGPADRGVRRPVARAVSYTHLRAHETVLDLVCRLLLEKKKPNRTTVTLSHITNENNHGDYQ